MVVCAEKERTHRIGSLDAYDKASSEHFGTSDLLGGPGGYRDLGRVRA